MPETITDRRRRILEEKIAVNLSQLRTLAGLSQEVVANSVRHGRNWLSEIERCQDKISLADFLLLMNFLRDMEPDHPAAALYDYYTNGPGSRLCLARPEPAG
jgi:hypothetical protein